MKELSKRTQRELNKLNNRICKCGHKFIDHSKPVRRGFGCSDCECASFRELKEVLRE